MCCCLRREYYLLDVEIKDFIFKISVWNFFDQPINNDIRTYENIWNNTSGCLLDSQYFRENYKKIAIGLSKQELLDADPRLIQ